jgi:predicted ArsR family transcriptional regulator
MPPRLDSLGAAAREVAAALKALGPSSSRAIARRVGTSGEAVRKGLAALEARELVERRALPASAGAAPRGRPPARFALTTAGEDLFPRAYADLAVALVDAVGAVLGGAALRRVLAAITDARVAALAPLVRGRSLAGRLAAARAVYRARDEHLSVRRTGATWTIEERDCPYLRVALERPALCSTTVSALSRILGVDVVREERFQRGAGLCTFRVDPARRRAADAPSFAPEPDPEPPAGT